MTKKNFLRSTTVGVMRANAARYSKPRTPSISMPHTTDELLGGGEFVGGTVHDDIAAYLAPLLDRISPHRFPRRFKSLLRQFADEPSLLRLRTLQGECAHILADHKDHGPLASKDRIRDPKKPRILWETVQVIRDLDRRLSVYGAAVGCQSSARRCAGMAFTLWQHANGTTAGMKTPSSYGLILSIFEYLATAEVEYESDFDIYVPEKRREQLKSVEAEAYLISATVSMVREALDMTRQYDPYEPTGDFGAAPPPPVKPTDPDPSDLADLVALEEDRVGIVRLPTAPEPDPVLLPAVPTLVVVGDLSHVRAANGKHDQDPAKELSAIAGKDLPLVTPPGDLAAVRAELLSEFPHAGTVIDRLLRPVASQESLRLPHVILWGQPGGGKTRFARRLGEALGLSPSVLSMAGLTDAVPLTGTPRGWSTAGFGIAVREFLRTKIANPMIVVDEADKIGTSRHNGNACDALINLLGAETSERYTDVYLQAPINASRLQWIITANDLKTVPRPLIDRCLVLELPEPGPEHLRPLASSILREIRDEQGIDEAWMPGLDGVEWNALETHWRGGSLRGLRRLIEAVIAARDVGPLQ